MIYTQQAWGFDDERLSVLFGLVKEVHEASVKQRLTIERSFNFFKDTLLNHSVHRYYHSTRRVASLIQHAYDTLPARQ